MQSQNSVAGVAFCDMCWKLAEASHETSILRWDFSGTKRDNFEESRAKRLF